MLGRPPLFDSPESMHEAIEKYFESATLITITGLALFLGFESRQSFYDYESKPDFSYIIKRARLRVECAYETRLNGTLPTGAIFALKNMGWKDKVETEHSGGIDINKKPSWFDDGIQTKTAT